MYKLTDDEIRKIQMDSQVTFNMMPRAIADASSAKTLREVVKWIEDQGTILSNGEELCYIIPKDLEELKQYLEPVEDAKLSLTDEAILLMEEING